MSDPAEREPFKARVEWGRDKRCRILLFAEDSTLLEAGEWDTVLHPTVKYNGRMYAAMMDGTVYELRPLERA